MLRLLTKEGRKAGRQAERKLDPYYKFYTEIKFSVQVDIKQVTNWKKRRATHKLTKD